MQDAPHYYLGLPMWNNRHWQGELFTQGVADREQLAEYASVFNTVEGNTSFYALPAEASVKRWRSQVPADFRFLFKFPRTVSHGRLSSQAEDLKTFLQRMWLLQDRIGLLWLQLPASFGPTELPLLEAFLRDLPAGFRYGLEVRHPLFFETSDEQRRLHDLLQRWQVELVSFDSRALFSSSSQDEAVLDAQRKKPRLPVRPKAVTGTPIVRYISHPDLAQNVRFLEPWWQLMSQWLQEGKTPYFFIHTPDNHFAPQLAQQFHAELCQRVPGLVALPATPASRQEHTGQLGLF